MDEREIIARLKEIFATSHDEDLIIGIGDDAALFRVGSADAGVVVATDLLTEGTHFNRQWSDLYSIGRKATAANLADIFAMGVAPQYLLVAVAFTPRDGEKIFDLARGIADECAIVGATVIGGDLSRSDSLTLSITALGKTSTLGRKGVLTRSGAKPGDDLFIMADRYGLPGKSLLGLEQLQRGIEVDSESIDLHRAPHVPYQSFLTVAEYATSLCDISDGISMDAVALAIASGVTIDIDRDALRSHPYFHEIARLAPDLGLDPVDVVLASGEEHAPLFTAPEGTAVSGAWKIGRVLLREEEFVLLDGEKFEPAGFRHF